MKKMIRHLYPSLATLLLVLTMPTTVAAGPADFVEVEPSASMVSFHSSIEYGNVRVAVSGPDGFEFVHTFSAGEPLVVELPALDGLYKYELQFAPRFDKETLRALNKARLDGLRPPGLDAGPKSVSGAFTIGDGSVVTEVEKPTSRPAVEKGVLSNTNGVIRNALCVGFDCPDSPAFGDSSVLMMENNNRIKFGDTSNSPFPNRDWEIEANSNLSGGLNYLAFNDCGTADNDGGCTTDLVFGVEGGVRQHALWVESDGDVGLGTQNPVVRLHVVDGDTPALRLEQDTSSGFGAQSWDIAGNETSFFVRDATNGSTLPFRIRPGAPSSAIDIAADGDVGIGTASPSGPLHVRRTTAGAKDMLNLENNGPSRFLLSNTSGGAEWRFNADDGDDLRIAENNTNAAIEFLLTDTGDLTITGNLVTGGGGACDPGPCDGTFTDYEVESIEEHASFMWENSHLWGVGPTPEGAPINVSKKVTGILHELEKAHIYIEQLHDRLKILESRLQDAEE